MFLDRLLKPQPELEFKYLWIRVAAAAIGNQATAKILLMPVVNPFSLGYQFTIAPLLFGVCNLAWVLDLSQGCNFLGVRVNIGLQICNLSLNAKLWAIVAIVAVLVEARTSVVLTRVTSATASAAAAAKVGTSAGLTCAHFCVFYFLLRAQTPINTAEFEALKQFLNLSLLFGMFDTAIFLTIISSYFVTPIVNGLARGITSLCWRLIPSLSFFSETVHHELTRLVLARNKTSGTLITCSGIQLQAGLHLIQRWPPVVGLLTIDVANSWSLFALRQRHLKCWEFQPLNDRASFRLSIMIRKSWETFQKLLPKNPATPEQTAAIESLEQQLKTLGRATLMLSGPTGIGKSTVAGLFGQKHDCAVYMPKLDETFYNVLPHSRALISRVILIDELDQLLDSLKDKKSEYGEASNLADVHKMLDCADGCRGMILICTSNLSAAELLQRWPTIFRPGRIDEIFEMTGTVLQVKAVEAELAAEEPTDTAETMPEKAAEPREAGTGAYWLYVKNRRPCDTFEWNGRRAHDHIEDEEQFDGLTRAELHQKLLPWLWENGIETAGRIITNLDELVEAGGVDWGFDGCGCGIVLAMGIGKTVAYEAPYGSEYSFKLAEPASCVCAHCSGLEPAKEGQASQHRERRELFD